MLTINNCCHGKAEIPSRFIFVDVYVAVNNINVSTVAERMLQWFPFAPLSRYKMFCSAVNDIKYSDTSANDDNSFRNHIR